MALPETSEKKTDDFSWLNIASGLAHLADNKLEEVNQNFPVLVHAIRKELKSHGFEVVFSKEPTPFGKNDMMAGLSDSSEDLESGMMIVSFRP